MKRTAPFLLLCTVLALAQRPTVMLTAEPSHHLALENEYVRVFKVEVAPKTATLLHFHGHDYCFVTLGDSHVSNEVEAKEPVDLKLADGETRFTAGKFAHVARNLSDQPFRNVTIELLQDETMRTAPSPWPMEGGDKEFPGVHLKVLFVKDGARATQVELQPGATVPSHHHDGPHLLVAVSDLDISSDVEGKGPMPANFKAGDIKWLPGGYTHTLTNTGKSVARLVTVDFAAAKPAAEASMPSSTLGKAVVKVDIDEKGKPLGVWMVRGVDQQMDKKILKAVKGWKFSPAKKNGKAVRVLVLVEITYKTNGEIASAGQLDPTAESR